MDISSLGLIFPAPFAWGLHVKRCPLWYLKKVLMEVLQPSKSYHYILQMNNILNRFGYLDFWSGESPEPTFTSSMELALLFRRSSLFNIRKSIKIWRCLPNNSHVLQLLESPPQLEDYSISVYLENWENFFSPEWLDETAEQPCCHQYTSREDQGWSCQLQLRRLEALLHTTVNSPLYRVSRKKGCKISFSLVYSRLDWFVYLWVSIETTKNLSQI